MYIEQQIEELKKAVDDLEKDIEHLKARDSERILTPKEFAALTKINENTVYTWIREGKIKILANLGTAKRIPMSQFYGEDDPLQYSSQKAATKAEELRKEFKKMRRERVV